MTHPHTRTTRRGALALGVGLPILALAAACRNENPSPTGTASQQTSGQAADGSATAKPSGQGVDLGAEREDPQVVPSFASTEGEAFEAAANVHLTVPAVLRHASTQNGQTRWLYYKDDNDFGLLDVVVNPFTWENAAEEADDQWQEYLADTSSTSALVQVSWSGASDAWSWTWNQPGDRSVFDSSLTGAVNLSGVSLILTTEGGQDLRVTAYAPVGTLKDSAAFAAMRSLTLG